MSEHPHIDRKVHASVCSVGFLRYLSDASFWIRHGSTEPKEAVHWLRKLAKVATEEADEIEAKGYGE